MIDLAMPRDIDPAVHKLDGIFSSAPSMKDYWEAITYATLALATVDKHLHRPISELLFICSVYSLFFRRNM